MQQIEAEPTARRHVLVQATVPPLDEDGRVAGVVGTLVFAVAILVITIRDNAVPAGADEVPLWIAMCGLGLGLLLLGYCELRIWQRRGRHAGREQEAVDTPARDAAARDA